MTLLLLISCHPFTYCFHHLLTRVHGITRVSVCINDKISFVAFLVVETIFTLVISLTEIHMQKPPNKKWRRMPEVLIKNLHLSLHQNMMFQRILQMQGSRTGVILRNLMTQSNRNQLPHNIYISMMNESLYSIIAAVKFEFRPPLESTVVNFPLSVFVYTSVY